jgi:hypothetical protein
VAILTLLLTKRNYRSYERNALGYLALGIGGQIDRVQRKSRAGHAEEQGIEMIFGRLSL